MTGSAGRDKSLSDTLIAMALVDDQRPDSYWESLRRGDENATSHDIVPARWTGAKCARCGAVNWALRASRCGERVS